MENSKKTPIWLILLIAGLFVALTVLVVVLIVNGSNNKKPTESTEPTGTENPAIVEAVEGYGQNAANALPSYAVLDTTPDSPDMTAIVAINDVNEACLNNAELQIYYWMEYNGFMNQYGYYASMMGLDTSKPLADQPSMMEDYTWEQYFLEAAAKFFGENYALAQAAYENGFVLSDEEAANIADLDDPNGKFAEEAANNNFSSVEEYIQATFGKGVGVEDYKNYLRTYYAAYSYYVDQQTQLEAVITDDDIVKHYDDNAEAFEEQSLLKVNNIAVRHLLISVEGDTDENGEYSAEAWAAAEATVNDIYADWQNNPTEDYFIELANEKSTDPGSNTNGGLYDDVYPGQMVTEFNDWCFAEDRAYGDHGIVKTPYGYHIMFFVGQNENRKWFDAAKEDLLGVKLNAMIDELVAKYPLKFDFTQVRIYDAISANAATTETE